MSDVKTRAQQWQRVKTILADALERPSPEDRTAYLERSCGGDTTLMREVEALLAQSTQNLDELAENTPMAFARHAPAQPSGRRIGAYEIVREIGRGGMGAVYLAKRADGQFEKEVAIKLLKRGTDTDEILRRFQAERRILARLDHPNIARLLDAGTTDDGLPYFVMEYVVGERITDFVRERKLSVPDRLALFLKICGAVECAHENHVVHRDLKPGNISVTRDGKPKLLDFGIAKLLEVGDEGAEATLTTERRMTPVCASPEQARGEAVTAASDVYALGALLYELLTEQTSHRFLSSHPSSSEVSQVVCEQEPLRPSLNAPNPETRRRLRGDLDKIVLMALRKEPTRRYSSVAEFAEDIERHLEGRPVHARPNTAAYLTTRFVARHKQSIGTLLVATVVALSFVLFYHPRMAGPPQVSGAFTAPEKSIAVLPLKNLSDAKDDAYLADAIQQEIVTNLGKIADLKVISPASVAKYKETIKDPREIGEAIQVAHLLEGSVQRANGRVHVSVQLVDTRSGAQTWADQFERDLTDVFGIQKEIAQKTAAQLQVSLSSTEKAAIETRPTEDTEAYDLYLRGNALMTAVQSSSDWVADELQAIDLLNRAVARDPAFALAYGLLARAHVILFRFGDHAPTHLAEAQRCAETALRIAPESGEAHFAQAAYLYHGQRDGERALRELTIAIRTLPNDAQLFDYRGAIERRAGQWAAALRDVKKAIELDPRNAGTRDDLIDIFVAQHNYADAEKAVDRALMSIPETADHFAAYKADIALDKGDTKSSRNALQVLRPSFNPSGSTSLAWALLALFEHNYAEAARVLAATPKESLTANFANSFALMEALVAFKQGDAEKAKVVLLSAREKLATELQARPKDASILSWLGLVDAGLGRKEDAVRESQQAVELLPVSRDASDGPEIAVRAAETYAWIGDRDRAFDQLASLARVPGGPSPGDLKLSPRWDGIRDDSRFAKLLEEALQPIDPTSTATISDKSIAVLPFENLSDDKSNSFFADGVQDEILTDLAKLKELKVISRTSVMQYKNGAARNLREIAQQLGVVHILEGSVQRAGNRIRISAQLIDARTDSHLWAEHYERDLADVFAIQNEIAKSIVEQLQAKISPSERKALEEKPTSDLVAYDLYLRAKALFDEISTSSDWEGDNRRAIDLAERAVTHDPKFALAYCLLSALNLNLETWVDHTSARLERAEAALEQAIRIAPEAGETYLARSEHYSRKGEWARALEMLALAQKALPGNTEALTLISSVEEHLGHWSEAIRYMEKAKELDPRGPNIPNGLTGMYRALREYAKSDQIADAAMAAFPNGPGYYLTAKAENALDRGDTKAARAALASIAPGWDPSGWPSELRVRAAVADRNYAEASHLLATVRKENLIERIAIRLTFLESLVASKQGDMAKAKSVLLPIRQTAELQLRERPDDNSPLYDSSLLSCLGRIDAYLGRKEDALRESEKAVELKPISRDAVNGPGRVAALAEVCMLTGDHDRAIQLLSELVKIPYGPSYGDLLGPRWDSLRSDPRFQVIIADSARPVKI